jgi:hypothetical protein
LTFFTSRMITCQFASFSLIRISLKTLSFDIFIRVLFECDANLFGSVLPNNSLALESVPPRHTLELDLTRRSEDSYLINTK